MTHSLSSLQSCSLDVELMQYWGSLCLSKGDTSAVLIFQLIVCYESKIFLSKCKSFFRWFASSGCVNREISEEKYFLKKILRTRRMKFWKPCRSFSISKSEKKLLQVHKKSQTDIFLQIFIPQKFLSAQRINLNKTRWKPSSSKIEKNYKLHKFSQTKFSSGSLEISFGNTNQKISSLSVWKNVQFNIFSHQFSSHKTSSGNLEFNFPNNSWKSRFFAPSQYISTLTKIFPKKKNFRNVPLDTPNAVLTNLPNSFCTKSEKGMKFFGNLQKKFWLEMFVWIGKTIFGSISQKAKFLSLKARMNI